jgi:hypothetical protein
MFAMLVQFWSADPFWAGHWGQYGLANECKYVGTNYDSCSHPRFAITNHPWQLGDKAYPKIEPIRTAVELRISGL